MECKVFTVISRVFLKERAIIFHKNTINVKKRHLYREGMSNKGANSVNTSETFSAKEHV